MSFYSLPSVISSILILVPIYHVVTHWARSYAVKLLGIFLFQLLGYMICEFLLINSTSSSSALFWDKAVYFFMAFMPATYFHILAVYPECPKILKDYKCFNYLIYFPSFIFIGLLPSSYLISGMQPEFWGYGKIEGPAYQWFRYYFLIYFAAYLSLFFYKLNKTKKRRVLNGMGYLGIAYIVPMMTTIFIMCVAQFFNINKFNIMVPSLSIIWLSFFETYALTHHYLYDLSLLPVFKTKKYLFHKELKGFISEIPQNRSFAQLILQLSHFFKCDVALNLGEHVITTKRSSVRFKTFQPDSKELFYWRNKGKYRNFYFADEMRSICPEIYHKMTQYDVDMLTPFYIKGKLFGLLKFGKGFSDKVYSIQDISLIRTLYEQLCLAFFYIISLEASVKEKDAEIRSLKQRLNKPNYGKIALKGGEIYELFTNQPMVFDIVDYDRNEVEHIQSTVMRFSLLSESNSHK